MPLLELLENWGNTSFTRVADGTGGARIEKDSNQICKLLCFCMFTNLARVLFKKEPQRKKALVSLVLLGKTSKLPTLT